MRPAMTGRNPRGAPVPFDVPSDFRFGAAFAVMLALSCGTTPADAAELRLCTQNLWNFGLPEEVHRHRRPDASLEVVRRDLVRQTADLAARLAACDVVAVQEVVGETEAAARAGLAPLTAALQHATGESWTGYLAEATDVIRNGFLVRENGRAVVTSFEGAAPAMPRVPGFEPARWTRAPAEIELRWNVGEKPGTTATTRALRLASVHLKSHFGGENDRFGESYERIRVVQASGLQRAARARLARDPGALFLILGDVNGDRGTACQLVLAGRLDPVRLLQDGDCIREDGRPACELPLGAPLLENLFADDPDLRGRGSYLFGRREELVDVVLASPAAAHLALEPEQSRDWDVALSGRRYRGSDHSLGRVTLRSP